MKVIKDFMNHLQSLDDGKMHNRFFIPELVKLSTSTGHDGLRIYNELKDEIVYEGDNYKIALDALRHDGVLWQSNKSALNCVKEVYLIHDNIFLSEENANSIQDGKGSLMKMFIIIKAGDFVADGSSSEDYSLFNSMEEALEEMKLMYN